MRNVRLAALAALAGTTILAFTPSAEARPTCGSCNPTKDIVDTAVAAGKFNTLVKLVGAAGLAETLKSAGPFTVLAPTDDAFAKVPADTLNALGADTAKLKSVLLYHVIPGRVLSTDAAKAGSAKTVNGADVTFTRVGHGLKVNDSNVIAADILATNGVIHAIDGVLLPPSITPPPSAAKDIVDTAVGAGKFSTLVKLVGAAGLVDTLKGAGPFTVFAPTDDAFAKVPADTLSALGADTAKLKAVLLYHVVAGKVLAADAAKLTSAKTVNGADVKITAANGGLKINDANVIAADVMASNGVIHVIDGVLIPPAATPPPAPTKDIVDTAVSSGKFTTLVKLVAAAGLVDTLKSAGPFTVFAPTDDAFNKVPAETLKALGADTAKLKAVLLYHVVAGKVLAADAIKAGSATTVNGASVTFSRGPVCLSRSGKKKKIRRHHRKTCGLKVNASNVIAKDIMASNGVIHVIDGVLLPPS